MAGPSKPGARERHGRAHGPPARRGEAAVFLLALCTRLLFCAVAYPFFSDRFGPGDGYDEIARNLAAGKGYTLGGMPAAPERLPLYPLLLAASFALFGDRSGPWQAAQSALGAATCVLVFRIARDLGPARAALAAALFCAVHPTLVLYAARPMSETLYVFLLALFVRSLFSARPGMSGLWLGGGLLVKSTAALHALAAAPLLGRGRRSASTAAPSAALLGAREGARLVAAAALVVAPWAIWNLATAGQAHLLAATSGRALYHGLYISRHVGWATPAGDLNRDAEIALRGELAARGVSPIAPAAVRDAVAGELARRWIATHPREWMRLFARNLALTWYLGRSRPSMAVHAALHLGLLLAAAAGFRRLWREAGEPRRRAMALGILVAAYTAFHAAVHPAVRYILPAVPLAAALAAACARPAAETRAALRRRPATFSAALCGASSP